MPSISLFLFLHLFPHRQCSLSLYLSESWQLEDWSEMELCNDLWLSSIILEKMPRSGKSRVCMSYGSQLNFIASSTLEWCNLHRCLPRAYIELSIAKNGPTLFSTLLCLVCVHAQPLSRVWLFVTPMDCNPPGSSVTRIILARILEWVAISSSRDLPDPGIEPTSPEAPTLAGRFFFNHWDP